MLKKITQTARPGLRVPAATLIGVFLALFMCADALSHSYPSPTDAPPERRLTVSQLSQMADYAAEAERLEAEGRFQAAEQPRQSVLTLAERTFGLNHPVTGVQANFLAEDIAHRDCAAAEPMFARTLAIYERAWGQSNTHPLTAIVLANIGKNHMCQYEFAQADPYLRRWLTILERNEGEQSPEILPALNMLALNFSQQLRNVDAAFYYRRALQLAEAAPNLSDSSRVMLLGNIGINQMQSGQSEAAEATFRRALAIARVGQGDATSLPAAMAMTSLATLLETEGRRQEAMDLRTQSLHIYESTPGVAAPDIAFQRMNFAAILTGQERLVEGETQYRLALDVFRQDSRFGSRHSMTLQTQLGLALNLEAQERFGDAEALYRDNVAAAEALAEPKPATTVPSYQSLAVFLMNRGRLAEAEHWQQRALSIAESSNDPIKLLMPLATLGPILLMQHRYDEAEHVFARELETAEHIFGNNSPESFDGALSLAALALSRGRPQEAMERAGRVVEADPSHAAASELFLYGAWNYRGPEADASDLAAAFSAAQTTNRSSTAAALAEGFARTAGDRAGVGPALLEWRTKQDELQALDAAIASAAGQGAVADQRLRELIEQRIRVAAEEVQSQNTIREQFPAYFNLLLSPALSLQETQHLLREDEALWLLKPASQLRLEQHRRGLVMVVTRERAGWAEIALDPEQLLAEISALRAQLDPEGQTRAANIGAAGFASSLRGYDRARAFRLYEALFPENLRAIAAEKTHWVLAPQASLLNVPYAALVREPPQGGSQGDSDPAALRQTHWLGTETVLQITPSVAALQTQRQTQPTPNGNASAFFGIGDPIFSSGGDNAPPGDIRSYFRDAAADLQSLRGLPRLPHTNAEIRRLAAALNASADDYVLGERANETEVRTRDADGRLGRARVIAFATHGLISGDLEGSLAEPALALTPPAFPSATDDGLLTASEVARLRLNARWVILSACNTAAGSGATEEGLTGLARAFFFAGARTLLVSQWPIEDSAAEQLTSNAVILSQDTSRPMRPAEAMRQAMTELLQGPDPRMAHPRTWAPFILVSAE